MHHDLDEDEEMVNPLQAGMLLVDWTDPQKSLWVVYFVVQASWLVISLLREVHGRQTDHYVHFDLAIELVRALARKDLDRTWAFAYSCVAFADDIAGEDKKVLCQLIGRLYLPDEVDDDKIRTLKLLVSNIRSVRCAFVF